MTTKLTLRLDDKVIQGAKRYIETHADNPFSISNAAAVSCCRTNK